MSLIFIFEQSRLELVKAERFPHGALESQLHLNLIAFTQPHSDPAAADEQTAYIVGVQRFTAVNLHAEHPILDSQGTVAFVSATDELTLQTSDGKQVHIIAERLFEQPQLGCRRLDDAELREIQAKKEQQFRRTSTPVEKGKIHFDY